MVSCTIIEAQIVFEMLLALVTGQLAIAGQLGREVHLWSVRLLLESGGQRWLGGGVLGRQGCQRQICLALGGCDRAGDGSFSLFPGGNGILDPIGEPLVIAMAQNTIPPT